MPVARTLSPVVSLLLLAASVCADDRKAVPTFEGQVRPILKAHCFDCHGEHDKPKGDLDVRLVRFLVKGGEGGPAVVAGKPDESPLVERITKHEMPPGKTKLSPEEIDVIRKWVAAGAKASVVEPEKLGRGFQITPAEEDFWSFRPIVAVAPPPVKHVDAVRNPVDAFLLARLEAEGFAFSPPADRATLIRRAYFDLIGLPPTAAEVDAFVNDPSADAYEKVIDRLLESPHYGERWGRHWLDVAGYADSEGVTGEDPPRKTAWKYRDYVIRSFNADKPWDRFIREQLAGDEMVALKYGEKLHTVAADAAVEPLVATGFLRMAPDGTASKDADVPVEANQHIADTIQIVSTAFLGLTVQCAQCHNHRYDPIAQVDYFRIRAIFEPGLNWKDWRSVKAREVTLAEAPKSPAVKKAEADALKAEQDRGRERLAQFRAAQEKYLDAELAKVPEKDRPAVREAFLSRGAKNGDEVKLLKKYANVAAITARLKKEFPPPPTPAPKPEPDSIRAFTEVPGKVPPTHWFDRGDHMAPKDPVTPAGLAVLARHKLGDIPEKDPKRPTTGRRSALADWITHERNPLTARVLVNRFWMHHFGKGLVNTPADLGALGERPSHPELLDWLAADFRAGGWNLKRFHKLIMTSTAYRQSSKRSEALDRVDPENRLLGRMAVRRLEAEIVRDAVLAVSGKLNPKRFGPPVPVMPDEQGQIVVGVDTRDGAGRPTGKVVPLDGDEFRRSVYVTVRRSMPLGVLELFDVAMPAPTCECRTSSTVAPQSLLMMNSPSVIEQSAHFADRVRREAGSKVRAQVALAWKHATAKEPTPDEADFAVRFLTEQAEAFRKRKAVDPARSALAGLCQALVGSNPFLYVD